MAPMTGPERLSGGLYPDCAHLLDQLGDHHDAGCLAGLDHETT